MWKKYYRGMRKHRETNLKFNIFLSLIFYKDFTTHASVNALQHFVSPAVRQPNI